MQQDGTEPPAPGHDRHAGATAGDRTTGPGFRLAVVPGVNPAKWLRVWQERLPDVPLQLVRVAADEAQSALVAGDADAALLRVPVDRDVLSAIPLYTETTVVVVPTDHVVAAADEVVAHDLADDVLLVPDDDVLGWADAPGGTSALPAPATTADAVELVAAGVGVLVVPQSLARLHHRRDLTHRPVTDAPTSSVALAWLQDAPSDLVEELIGIVRGRTANSSRGTRGPSAAPQDADRAAASGAGATRGGSPAGGSPRGGSARGASSAGGAPRGKSARGGSGRGGPSRGGAPRGGTHGGSRRGGPGRGTGTGRSR